MGMGSGVEDSAVWVEMTVTTTAATTAAAAGSGGIGDVVVVVVVVVYGGGVTIHFTLSSPRNPLNMPYPVASSIPHPVANPLQTLPRFHFH